MYYYLYRFYDPNLQRWINRDPIEERGGINLYTFVRNSPTRWFDSVGFDVCSDLENIMDTATGNADAAAERGDIDAMFYNIGLVVQAGNLYEALGCGGPPSPPPVVNPIVCPVQGRRVPQDPYPPTNRTFCERHPTICTAGIIVGAGAVIVGTGILIIGSGGTAAPVLIGVGVAL
jgi:hypothetical protein